MAATATEFLVVNKYAFNAFEDSGTSTSWKFFDSSKQ